MSEQIRVPNELQPCLREFTKAVLRDMPEDVLLYSRDYFVEKAAQARMASYSLPASTSKPFSELALQVQQQIEDVFKRYDSDCDQALTITELRTLMSDLGGLFGLSEEVDASILMALLDADGLAKKFPLLSSEPFPRQERHAILLRELKRQVDDARSLAGISPSGGASVRSATLEGPRGASSSARDVGDKKSEACLNDQVGGVLLKVVRICYDCECPDKTLCGFCAQ